MRHRKQFRCSFCGASGVPTRSVPPIGGIRPGVASERMCSSCYSLIRSQETEAIERMIRERN